jgi:hypothetical protein
MNVEMPATKELGPASQRIRHILGMDNLEPLRGMPKLANPAYLVDITMADAQYGSEIARLLNLLDQREKWVVEPAETI